MSTQNIPFPKMKKKITQNYPKSAAMGFFSKGTKNKLKTAMVNEASVFEPLKVYCTGITCTLICSGLKKRKKPTYSQLSLSRLRLSRITAYLEEKIWSLF